jgi:predicted chitinase
MVTDEELKQIMPRLPGAKRGEYLPFLQQAMAEFEINTYLRESAFLAQLAHESAELRFMEEIASGSQYEGRRDLGNTQPGDGRRFKGRGPIQLTGRANYRTYGQKLGLDLIANPKLAATPSVGFRIAGLFWKSHGLNELADEEKLRQITRRINGGFNGLADREMYYRRARLVLSRDDAQPTEPINVTVNGLDVPNARPFWRNGHVMLAIRPVAEKAGWRILEAGNGRVLLQDVKKANHELPLLIQGSIGFVEFRALPPVIRWDGETHTALWIPDA